MNRSSASILSLHALLAMLCVGLLALGAPAGASGQAAPSPGAVHEGGDYSLGPGDLIQVTVFQQPDLSLEARISERGFVSYPLIGAIKLGGLSSAQAERAIGAELSRGNFLRNPQVSVNVLEYRSQQVSVLGAVNRPGRYALQAPGTRLSEVLAQAGGIVTGVGADSVNLLTRRDGRPVSLQIDLAEIFVDGDLGKDEVLRAGDALYVPRAPAYYIYGQVQRPGMYSVERGMTVSQAVAKAGGLTARGTERGMRLQRGQGPDGAVQNFEVRLDEPVRADDLVFVPEGWF